MITRLKVNSVLDSEPINFESLQFNFIFQYFQYFQSIMINRVRSYYVNDFKKLKRDKNIMNAIRIYLNEGDYIFTRATILF